tara:strand:- start:123 stop:695 length:573 start_codon:yes stop_codon:yes gene_type:complete
MNSNNEINAINSINANNSINAINISNKKIKYYRFSRTLRMYNSVDNIIVNNTHFDNKQKYKIPKNVRVNYKIVKKKSNRMYYDKLNLILKNQNEIIDKTVAFVSDNMVNELLYLLKFYHLTNDNINSFIYIVFYEMVWIGYKIIRINTNKNFDISKEDSQLLCQQLIINILLYIFVKNLFVNTIVNTLNK